MWLLQICIHTLEANPRWICCVNGFGWRVRLTRTKLKVPYGVIAIILWNSIFDDVMTNIGPPWRRDVHYSQDASTLTLPRARHNKSLISAHGLDDTLSSSVPVQLASFNPTRRYISLTRNAILDETHLTLMRLLPRNICDSKFIEIYIYSNKCHMFMYYLTHSWNNNIILYYT